MVFVLTFGIILGLAIGIPLLIGGGAIAFKVINLLFFSNVGGFPLWALIVIIVVVYMLWKKTTTQRYY